MFFHTGTVFCYRGRRPFLNKCLKLSLEILYSDFHFLIEKQTLLEKILTLHKHSGNFCFLLPLFSLILPQKKSFFGLSTNCITDRFYFEKIVKS